MYADLCIVDVGDVLVAMIVPQRNGYQEALGIQHSFGKQGVATTNM